MIVPIYVSSWGDISVEIPEIDLELEGIETKHVVFLHVKQRRWSSTIYKEMLDVWAELCIDLKEAGYRYVASLIPEEDRLTNKFQSMFGLEVYAQTEGLNLHLMEL
jgi:hypothetical protein